MKIFHPEHDPASGVVVTAKGEATEKRSQPRAGNTEEHGDDATARIFSGHEKLRDGSDDEADDTGDEDSCEIHRWMTC